MLSHPVATSPSAVLGFRVLFWGLDTPAVICVTSYGDEWTKACLSIPSADSAGGLTLIHLIGIPPNKPLREPRPQHWPGDFVGGWAIAQLWLFWVAPIICGALGGALYAGIFEAGTPS